MKVKVLPCKCHRVSTKGDIFTKIVQFSVKGKQGIQTTIGKKWNCLSPVINKIGYKQTSLHGKNYRVNRLVASAFLKNPYAHPEVHHKNGNRIDNRIENLEWGNAKGNAEDREKHGNTARGESNLNSKLKENEVRKIRKLRESGMTFSSIADRFGVSKKLIILINQRKIWKHIN